jgi:DNA-binding GntR family transcriptional regulator
MASPVGRGWGPVSDNGRQGGETLAYQAYVVLRQSIVRGELRPNQRLVETELAQMLNVSRTPVREALQLLAADRLVLPQRTGWVVREHTAEEICQIYETAAALESFSGRLAAERATSDQLMQIREALAEVDGERTRDREKLVGVNDHFHDSIAEAAANPALVDLIRRSRLYYFNYRLAEHYSDEELAASHEQHRMIVAALERMDGDAAERLIREHIATTTQVALTKLYPGFKRTHVLR